MNEAFIKCPANNLSINSIVNMSSGSESYRPNFKSQFYTADGRKPKQFLPPFNLQLLYWLSGCNKNTFVMTIKD